ncbi:transcriptional regulator family: C2H2 zinc finger [Paecilomyces variotii]|nr:transcriptional regulator family: C2H2 zinc finger [Paecilomyces variotii]KAJ9220122.1 transcriptional regulator family: C2H2 zinc finger [Paecilomyces variotii]KAJ9230450.1 transcriptional regulator family: C2H2 zinc finger [Paecilomyces variotii]KAJ9235671.1 transcriptional regulator family: C2H2 zinc finger [Paecilomyces variotii]KAJ9249074.1 transcriptional regulator family: C2H2 zinc finger [Paecilomyces variotii]
MDLANLVTRDVNDSARVSSHRHSTSQVRTYDQYREGSVSDSYFPSSTTSYVSRSPQPPLSPPVEDQRKCSLPSISSLLEGADRSSIPATKRQRQDNPFQRERAYSHAADHIAGNASKVAMPPTPPLRPDSGFHSTGHSPSSSTCSQFTPSNARAGSPASASETYQQRHQPYVTLPSPTERGSISQESQSRYSAQPYASPAPSNSSYSSPVEVPPAAAYYQRPPPPSNYNGQNYVTPMVSSTHPQMISPVTPAWQHHHYFPPSSSDPYPQNHDRYICRTCHKAFSRPSSLRIHSHSHTGEKPFRCTHVGCGKAFSVRSNMKRHERGCHSGRPMPTAMV